MSQGFLIRKELTGVVVRVQKRRGFGFIRLDSLNHEVFFHVSEVPGRYIEVNDDVIFDLCVGPKGLFAESIEFLNEEQDDSSSESDQEEQLIQHGVIGVVKEYKNRRNYGFIRVNDSLNRVFFHISEVPEEYIEVGDEVIFDLCNGPKGYFAESIAFLNQEDDSSSESDESEVQEKFLFAGITGFVKRYLNRRRYGFITVNETYRKVFFHISSVCNQPVEVRDEVVFDLYVGPKGYFAKAVRIDTPDPEDQDWDDVYFDPFGFHDSGIGTPPPTTGVPRAEERHPGNRTTPPAHDHPSKCAGGTVNPDTSRLAREQGNVLFKSAHDQTSDAAKSDHFKSALECYKKAYTSSQKDDDLVSAAKNIGTVSWKLAKLKMNSCSDARKDIHAYFKDALQHFSTAYTKRSCMIQKWAEHLEKSLRECLDDIRSWIAPRSDDDRIVVLKEYVSYLSECAAKVSCYYRIASLYFNRGKDAFRKDELKQCQGYMDECCTSLNEAKKRCTAGVDESFIENITDLEKDIKFQKNILQKCLSRAKGEQERRAKEQREAEELEKAKNQLKGDLKKLERLQKLPIEKFVEEIYVHWPPKGGGGSKTTAASSSSSSSSSRGSEKKLVMRAISQYHPDKLDKEDHDIKWKVMSCEITKCLTQALGELQT